MHAVLTWQVVVADFSAIAGFVLLVLALLRFMFKPRIQAWTDQQFRRALEPMREDLVDMKETNTTEHEARAESDREFREEVADRWESHNEKHDIIARSLGRLEGAAGLAERE